MGQNGSTHHEPLDRVANRSQRHRRSLRLPKGERQSGSSSSPKRMDRLRRSFRDSFRRRKEHIPESTKPHQWQADEAGVKAGTCTFHVKYLGCVEVFESRGMQVCEEALKVLRNSRRRPVKAILYVSGDGLRVVEDETKGLIVDQTIEKVSFCAPDRNHEKGFSYICRDGTTRRWMCHGFFALKETGERLSHAVGCAFAACLERKQRRDKECGVTMTFDPKNSTFTRSGSFRQPSITDRLYDVEPPPVKSVSNPFAIERPHATVSMMERQGSFRGFQQLNQASPFKRQMSLRIGDLPSTLERQRSQSLEGSDFRLPPAHLKPPVSPIPEASPSNDKSDSVSVMCQQLAQGLSLLSHRDDDSAPPAANSVLEMDAVTLNMVSTLDNCNEPAASGATETNSWSDSVTKSWGGAGPALPPRPAPSPQRLPILPPAVADSVTTVAETSALPGAEQWLGRVTNVVGLRRPPPLGQHARAFSLGSGESYMRPHNANGDPFDAEWAAIAARNEQANTNTNPFVTSSPVM